MWKVSLIACLFGCGTVPLQADDLVAGFTQPPDACKPRVWWHWMNGNVTKAGITADLEAMAKAGIGGAHLFDVGCGIPPGEVKFNTPSWDDHVDWAAKEAERLGLELTLVNCSGYANAGGPWIAPSNSMFYVQYTETVVKGGTTFRGVLPRMKDDHGFYRDIAVLAFPCPACEHEPKGGLRVASPSSCVRVVSADEPFTLGGFTFSAEYGWGWTVPAKVRVEVSDDGKTWCDSETVDFLLSSDGRSDCNNGAERYLAFVRPARGRAVRITMIASNCSFEYKAFRPELRRGLPDLNARTFRSYGVTAPCSHEVGADAAVDPARILDLTDRLASDGSLVWDAPAGDDWVVLRVGYASNGVVVHPASSFGGGLEVNKLDAAAVDIHFDAYAGRLAKGRKAIKAVLCDSYEVGTQNWTHGLERIFAREKGYSLVPYLIAFSGRVVGSAKQTDEVLLDYRRLISDLFVKNFVEESGRKARAAGLRYAMEPYGNMSADTTHYAAKADLPMTEFWVTQDDGVSSDHVGHADTAKSVSSAAHLHGRDVVDAEAFTAFPLRGGRWLKDPFGLKAMGDFYYAHGVTRMVYHRFAHQPWTEPARLPGMTMGQWGTHFERTETWWPMVGPWLKYQARCQYLLSSGRPANDLLVYAGDAVPNTGTPEAVPEGWSWDICGMHDLEDISVVGGRLVPRDALGVSYAALVVPTNRLITAASRARLEQLRAAGATLLKSGERPSFAPDFAYSGTSEKVRSICRRQDDGTLVWFVAYPSTNAATVRCSFRAAGPAPQLWDAETGERFRPYDWASADGRTEVTLPFRPCGSWFVVFPAQADRSALPPLADPSKEGMSSLAKLVGPWTLSFPKGWNCPGKLTLPKLVSWTEIPDGEVRYFSGIAEYSYRGRVPARGEGRVFLDLGRVKNVAEVTVNGRVCPPLWRPPFRVDVTDALRADGSFDLTVRVANLWPNRLIGDERKPADCEWGYEWNELAIKEIPAWVKAGKPSPTGRLSFTTWHHWTKDDSLLESGLIGPVTLERTRPVDALDPFVPYRFEMGNPAEAADDLRAIRRRTGLRRFLLTGPGFNEVMYAPFADDLYAKMGARMAEVKRRLADTDIEVGWWCAPSIRYTSGFSSIEDASGNTSRDNKKCPLDPAFQADWAAKVKSVVSALRPRVVNIEDDYTLSWGRGLVGGACYCRRHLAAFARRYGKALTAQEIVAAFDRRTPSNEPIRRAFAETVRDSLCELAAKVRAAVDEVDPSVRIMLCESGACCDRDGDDLESLARAFAGPNTRPCVRPSGAIYGAQTTPADIPGAVSHAMYTLERLPRDVETFYEADPYPHNRFFTSAAQMQSLMAGSVFMGSQNLLFYCLQYLDDPLEDPGYADAYNALRSRLDAVRAFVARDARLAGVRVYWRSEDAYLTQWKGGGHGGQLNDGAFLCAKMGLPYTTRRDAKGPVMLLGNVAETMSDDEIRDVLSGDVLLDAPAAALLQQRGFGELLGTDVMLAEGRLPVVGERLLPAAGLSCRGRTVNAFYILCAGTEGTVSTFATLKPHVGAEVWSEFTGVGGKLVTPSLVYSKNARGGRVAVLATSVLGNRSSGLFNLRKQELLQNLFRRMDPEALPVVALEVPGVWTLAQVSADGSEMLVMVNNLSGDVREDLTLAFSPAWSRAEVSRLDAQGVRRPLGRAAARWRVPCRLDQMTPEFLVLAR